MVNTGATPPSATSPVGILRRLIGDTNFVPLVPPVFEVGSYDRFSDAELTLMLTMAGGSNLRAAGMAVRQMATAAALEGAAIAQDDLRADITKRADQLFTIAKDWFRQADEEDARTADAAASFEIFFPTPTHSYPRY